METKQKHHRQARLALPRWGNRQLDAARKRAAQLSRVPHRTRPPLASHYPVQITWRLLPGLPNLRRNWTFEVVLGAFTAARDRFGVRLVHFSVRSNHLHLIVEGRDKPALSKAMQGLGVRLAKRLNKEWGRRGTVFADRYRARILRVPREVRGAVRHLLENTRKHGIRVAGAGPYCSAHSMCRAVMATAKTWLLTTGLQRRARAHPT